MYHRDPDVSWRVIEGQVVMIHNRRGEVQVLNEAGTLVWEHIDRGVDTVVDEMCRIYEVDRGTASADVRALLQQLIEFGALHEEPGAA